MSDTPKPSVFQTPDDAALVELRALVGEATYASIAALSPEDGHPMCSRVGMSTLADGTPIIFVSSLSAHTPSLLADPRCSLLVGQAGKGDPLTHARATLVCMAEPLAAADPLRQEAAARYLSSHPKAKLYAEFPDFLYFVLRPIRAHYVAGFGRAYVIEGDVLTGA